MANKAILPLMLIIQPFSAILRTLVRRNSYFSFIKIFDFSPNSYIKKLEDFNKDLIEIPY